MDDVKLNGYVYNKKVMQSKNDGNNFVTFTIAKRKYNFQTKNTEMIYINCVLFGKRSEYFINNIQEKDHILLSGELDENKYTNKEGKEIKTLQIIVSDVMLITHKTGKQEITENVEQNIWKNDDDDMPF